jgi:hypothetical protein
VFVEAVINSPPDALAPAATPVTAETSSPPAQVAVRTGISMPGAFPDDNSDIEFLASAPLASGSEPPIASPKMPGAFPDDNSDIEFLASAPLASGSEPPIAPPNPSIELPSPAVEHVAHSAMPPPAAELTTPAAELTSSTIELPIPAVEHVAPSVMPPPPAATSPSSTIKMPSPAVEHVAPSATPPPAAASPSSTIEMPNPAVEHVAPSATPPPAAASLSFNVGPAADLSTSRIELPITLPPQSLPSATPPPAAESLPSPAVEDVDVASAPPLPVAELPSTLPPQALPSATPPAAELSSNIGPAAELSGSDTPQPRSSVDTTAKTSGRKFSFAEAAEYIAAGRNARTPRIIHHDGRLPPVIPPIVKIEPINDSDDEKRTLELGSSALPSTKDAVPFARPRPRPAVAPLTAEERRTLKLSSAPPLSTKDDVLFARPPTRQAVAPLTPDQKHFQIYMDMPDDEDWASQQPIVSSVKKQVTIAKSIARNLKDTYWLIKKGKTKPKIKSGTLVSDQHQVPKIATAVSSTSRAAWACPSVHHEGVAAGFISYNPGYRGSCYGCHGLRNQHAKVQDWSIPAGTRIFQISDLYFADGFGNVRLQYGKHHARRGNSAAPLAYYEAINTGLGAIRKDQFIGLTYYTEAEIRAGVPPKRRAQSVNPTSTARSRSRMAKVSQPPMESRLTAEPDTPDVDSENDAEAELDKPEVNSENAAVGKHERNSHGETPLSYSRKRMKMSPAAEEHFGSSEDWNFDFSDSRKPGPTLEELLQTEDVDSDKSETELDKPGVDSENAAAEAEPDKVGNDSENAGKHEHDSHDKTPLSYSRKRMKMSAAANEHVGSSEDWNFEMDAEKIDSAILDVDEELQAAIAEEYARENRSGSDDSV